MLRGVVFSGPRRESNPGPRPIHFYFYVRSSYFCALRCAVAAAALPWRSHRIQTACKASSISLSGELVTQRLHQPRVFLPVETQALYSAMTIGDPATESCGLSATHAARRRGADALSFAINVVSLIRGPTDQPPHAVETSSGRVETISGPSNDRPDCHAGLHDARVLVTPPFWVGRGL